jgi:uncharacterized protein (TIGR00661 family)
MKFAFIIQGEGRGHQTQAISLAEMLEANGHKIVIALVGTVNPSKIPVLLSEKANFKIELFQSPSLIFNKKTNALSLRKTVLEAIPNLIKYKNSISLIKNAMAYYEPDLIITFYDFLGGLYGAFHKTEAKVVCIGHQYLMLNDNFSHPAGYWIDRQIVNFNTWVTALGSHKKLALSFSTFKNYKNTISVPPLLRNELKSYISKNQGFILVYLTQAALVYEVIREAEKHPNTVFEIFIDKELSQKPSNVRINPISSTIFLQKMALCKGVISTAGFEAICEAMYLGKPALMVPIKNHYEQHCNAIDGQRAGAGLFTQKIDVGQFLEYIETHQPAYQQKWIDSAETTFLKELVVPKKQIQKRITEKALLTI